jgi:hypothetical protein
MQAKGELWYGATAPELGRRDNPPTRTVPRPTKDKVGSFVYLKPVCGRASLVSCPEKLVLILWAYKRAKQNNC